MGYQLTEVDKQYLQENQPRLKPIKKKWVEFLIGEICFSWWALWSELKFIHWDNINHDFYDIFMWKKTLLVIKHKISIQLTSCSFPKVKEIWWYYNHLTEKWINTDKLHINKHPNLEKTLCLCTLPHQKYILDNWLSIKTLLEDLIFPFLYWWNYLELYWKRPFWEYSHGILWNLEYYADLDDNNKNSLFPVLESEMNRKEYRLKDNPKCFCGSWKLFSECHSKAYEWFQDILFKLNLF